MLLLSSSEELSSSFSLAEDEPSVVDVDSVKVELTVEVEVELVGVVGAGVIRGTLSPWMGGSTVT
jgi:hypothetical protein